MALSWHGPPGPMIRAYENHWCPLMFGRKLKPYFPPPRNDAPQDVNTQKSETNEEDATHGEGLGTNIKGILAAPPKATPPRNKGLIRPYKGKPMVNKPLIKPYFWGGGLVE